VPLEVRPETECIVRREIASGRFGSAGEIIQRGIDGNKKEADSGVWARHRESIEWTLNFAKNRGLPLEGITIKELIEEGRRMWLPGQTG